MYVLYYLIDKSIIPDVKILKGSNKNAVIYL